MELGQQAAGIGALADETRRALYAHVVGQREPVGREQAATAVGVAVHSASFHLDRLVDEGLLDVEYRRLTGRTGPGAGRPSKLYLRSGREFAVSLPPRRYDLVGDILASAVDRATHGTPLAESLQECAHEEGVTMGRTAGPDPDPSLNTLAAVLGTQGYEPTIVDGAVVLANCPFDALAQKHTDLVCSLNRSFVQGVAEGLGCGDVVASLEPQRETCCVRARVISAP